MDMPHPLARPTRSAFTLVEMIVVVAILLIAVLVFATFMGPVLAGPSIQRHIASVKGMTSSVRQNASVRQVHGELIFDYRNDQVIALSRRRLTSFSFDVAADGAGSGGSVGSGGVIANLSGGARLTSDRSVPLRDGDALELPAGSSSFNIPWMPQFESEGSYEGIAVAFDFYPMEEPPTLAGGDSLPPAPGPIVRLGATLVLVVVESRPGAIRLALSSSGVVAESPTWIALHRWATVEVAVSAYGVSLYVDGRLSEGELPERFMPAGSRHNDMLLGGVPCRIDNVDLMGLVTGRVLELEGTQLIARDVDPFLELTGQAEQVYDPRQPQYTGPITGPGADEPEPAYLPGLPLTPPPGLVHVYFDGAGRLDPARHAGALEIYLVSGNAAEIVRAILTFHPLGAVTHEYVERFDWEQEEQEEQE